MRLFLLSVLVSFHLYADEIGLATAISLSNATSAQIKGALHSAQALNKELEKSVELNRRLLKAEIIRDILLSKKVYWIDKLKKNIERSFDMNALNVQVNLVNNKVWIYNNSLLYGNLHIGADDE